MMADVEVGGSNEPSLEENENIATFQRGDTTIPQLVIDNEKKQTIFVADPPAPAVLPAAVEQVGTTGSESVKLEPPISPSKRFYPGDVVVGKHKANFAGGEPCFGSVLKPVSGSEMAESPDRGSSTNFHVHWDVANRIALVNSSEVALVDRILPRGQRVEDKEGNVGTVVDCEIEASVQINGTDYVMERVPLYRLQPISSFVRGQEVMMDGWVGVITAVSRNVWFRMDSGAVLYIPVNETDGFTRTDPFWGIGVACPGMRTRLSPTVLKKAKWISQPMRILSRWLPAVHYIYSMMFATIIRTEITHVEVKWLNVVPGIPTPFPKQPGAIVQRRDLDLKRLLSIGMPSTESIGINSVRKIKISAEDTIVSRSQFLKNFKNVIVEEKDDFPFNVNISNNNVLPLLSTLADSGNDETPVKVLLRHNIVTVEWKDGKIVKLPAIRIHKVVPRADDGEFPMGLVVAPLQNDNSIGEKYGIIMESNDLARERTRQVNVRWITEGKDEGVEAVSVFDIRPHSDYSMYQRSTILFPRDTSGSVFPSAVVIDVNLRTGKMIVIKSNDNLQDEAFPHQVVALEKRCYWSFFSRSWVVNDILLPPYQLSLEFDPLKKLVDVNDKNSQGLEQDTNNPQNRRFNVIWDETTFELLSFAPATHRYYNCSASESFGIGFAQKIESELRYLKEKRNVPEGIWIRCYENRLDLISVLMVGPTKTPYEDGLFLFDIKLPPDFPNSRPAVHYVSYTLELHPLLSFDGNVCVSSIPWGLSSKEEETRSSYISLFLLRLQALIFTSTPYFSGHKSIKEGLEKHAIKARMYNQGVVVRVLDSTWNMLQNPHEPWRSCIRNHFATTMPKKYLNIEKWINDDLSEDCEKKLEYPLLPAPEGLKMALKKRLQLFQKLTKVPSAIVEIQSVTDTTADSESFAVHEKEAEEARLLTPVTEIMEPSSASTFCSKLSKVVSESVSVTKPQVVSLDSLKNIKQNPRPKSAGGSESDLETPEKNLVSNDQ